MLQIKQRGESPKPHMTLNDAFSQPNNNSLKDWGSAQEMPIKRTTKPHTKPIINKNMLMQFILTNKKSSLFSLADLL